MNKDRAGRYVTVLSGEARYKAYKPNGLLELNDLYIDSELLSLTSKAHYLLGQLDSVSTLVDNVDLFLSSYVRKEALLSSQIEGTQATLEDVLDPRTDILSNHDVEDVVNYVSAINWAISRLKDFPICSRFFCEIHKRLMRGVRGEEKRPGEFRRSQNWIGSSSSSIKTAKYIPPRVEDLAELLSDLEKFINYSSLDILIKTALCHYQFETIHPFLDGNGRVGRMLIVLMLLSSGVLKKPLLYPSLYFKSNQAEYYAKLSLVRETGDYESWLKFFILGIVESTKDCINTISLMDKLFKDDEKKLKPCNITEQKIFNFIKANPIFTFSYILKELNLQESEVLSFVTKLRKLDIVQERSSREKEASFEYSKYLEILRLGI